MIAPRLPLPLPTVNGREDGLVPDEGTFGLKDWRRVGAAGRMVFAKGGVLAESGVGRLGREVEGCSSDFGGIAIEDGRSTVGVGRRADESKDEEGRMSVAVGRSVAERKVQDGP